MSTSEGKRWVVVGLGNPLMGDDGLGIHALHRLEREWTLDVCTELVDGGTWGLSLLPEIEGAAGVLFLDAIHTGAEPGTLIQLRGDDVPRLLATKLSPHEIDLREVLAVMQLRGTLPDDVTVIGVEPESVELRDELSATVEARVDDVVECALDQLRSWQVRCERIQREDIACTR